MSKVIHYHLPEGTKPSPLIQAFMEAADAAACLPPQCVPQPDDDDEDELDEDEDGYPPQEERDYDEFDFEPDYDAEAEYNEGALIDRIMNGGDNY